MQNPTRKQRTTAGCAALSLLRSMCQRLPVVYQLTQRIISYGHVKIDEFSTVVLHFGDWGELTVGLVGNVVGDSDVVAKEFQQF
jgi:hypothetical protein